MMKKKLNIYTTIKKPFIGSIAKERKYKLEKLKT